MNFINFDRSGNVSLTGFFVAKWQEGGRNMDLLKFLEVCTLLKHSISKGNKYIIIHSDGDDNKSNSFDCAVDVAYGLSGIEIELVKESLDKCHFNCVLAGNLEAIVIIDCFRDIAESFYTEDSDAAQNMLMYLKGYCEA